MGRATYHHGDLRAALVDAAVALLAEKGADQVSVAEVARRAGVSGGAPYRHFSDRRALMIAVSIRSAERLTAGLRSVVAAETDDRARVVAAGSLYVTVLMRDRAGIDLIYAPEVVGSADPELIAAGRELMDEMLPLAWAVRPDIPSAMTLLDQVLAVCHGYASLFLSGFLNRQPDAFDVVVQRTTQAVQALVVSETP